MYGLHYPDRLLVLALFELLCEDRVLARHVVGQRQVVVAGSLLSLALALEGLLVAFDIFGEKVLPADLIEVPEVVDAPVGEEPYLVECFGDELLLAPVDVPVVVFGLAVGAAGQSLLDAVGEVGLELDFAAEWSWNY